MDTNNYDTDILLIEDDLNDAELTIRELKKHNLINKIHHIDNGAAVPAE